MKRPIRNDFCYVATDNGVQEGTVEAVGKEYRVRLLESDETVIAPDSDVWGAEPSVIPV